jgi:hypothetical protein
MKIQKLDTSKLAKTGSEYTQLLATDADWIARSADDVKSLRAANASPLSKLSEQDFSEFVSSLKFSGRGLGHANYKPLMSSLSLTEIYQVFAYFGLSRMYVLDTQDYYCESHGNCKSQLFSICTSTC